MVKTTCWERVASGITDNSVQTTCLKVKITCWDRVASCITGKRAGEAQQSLATHLGEGKLLFQTSALLRKHPLVEKTSGDNLEENQEWSPKGGLTSNSGLSQSAHLGGSKHTTDKIWVLSTRRRVQTNWMFSRMLQLSTEPVITTFSVPSDFYVGKSS